MAITKLSNCPAYMDYDTAKTVSLESVSEGATVGIPMPSEDYESFLMLTGNGTNSSTITLYTGNGLQGTGTDLSITLGKDDTILLNIESGHFKFVSGEYKGCLKMASTKACTAMLYVLPSGKQSIS